MVTCCIAAHNCSCRTSVGGLALRSAHPGGGSDSQSINPAVCCCNVGCGNNGCGCAASTSDPTPLALNSPVYTFRVRWLNSATQRDRTYITQCIARSYVHTYNQSQHVSHATPPNRSIQIHKYDDSIHAGHAISEFPREAKHNNAKVEPPAPPYTFAKCHQPTNQCHNVCTQHNLYIHYTTPPNRTTTGHEYLCFIHSINQTAGDLHARNTSNQPTNVCFSLTNKHYRSAPHTTPPT
jgi:hypothetical protein